MALEHELLLDDDDLSDEQVLENFVSSKESIKSKRPKFDVEADENQSQVQASATDKQSPHDSFYWELVERSRGKARMRTVGLPSPKKKIPQSSLQVDPSQSLKQEQINSKLLTPDA